MYYLLVVVFGLVVGSFLNVVIYRMHIKDNVVKGKSYCPKCKHPLGFWDLFPIISFILLQGKCRYCDKKISWQYPLVEAVTALAFLLVYIKYGFSLNFFVYLIYSSFLIVIFVYDFRYLLILDKISIPAIIVSIFGSIFILKFSLAQIALAILIGGGFFLFMFLISKGKWIGGGDIRMGIVMGAMLGLKGLTIALFIAYFVGALIGVFLILLKLKKWKSQIPFGTFLSAATFIVLMYGQQIYDWYTTKLLAIY